jgi:hypothetical protein
LQGLGIEARDRLIGLAGFVATGLGQGITQELPLRAA